MGAKSEAGEAEFVVRVIHSFTATGSNQIPLQKGELLTVVQRDSSGWWIGRTANGRCGVFPSTYVQRECSEPPPDDAATTVAYTRVLQSLHLDVLAPVLTGVASRPRLSENRTTEAPYIDDLFAMDETELTDEIQNLNRTIDDLVSTAAALLKQSVQKAEDVASQTALNSVNQQLLITRRRADAVAEELAAAIEEHKSYLQNLEEAGISLPKSAASNAKSEESVSVSQGSSPTSNWVEKAGGDVAVARYLEKCDAAWTLVNKRLDSLESAKAAMAADLTLREREIERLTAELASAEARKQAESAAESPSPSKVDRKVAKARRELESVVSETTNVEREIAELRTQVQNGSAEYETLVAQFEQLRQRSDAAYAEVTSTAAETAQWNQRCESLQGEIDALTHSIAQVHEEATKARSADAQLYRQLERERRVVYNELQELRGNLRVYCRLRPRGPVDAASVRPIDDIALAVTDPYTDDTSEFEFDLVLPEKATQEHVFQEVQPLVTSILDGYNVCIFAYGQTGSGKTHTMEGTASDPGVSYRTLAELFALAAERRSDGYEAVFRLSVLEVYNDKIFDLIDGRKPAVARWAGKEAGVVVQPQKLVDVSSVDEVQLLLQAAYANRSVAGTDCNQHSSRSHCLLTIHVTSTNEVARSKFNAKLHLIDLAGSERIKISGVEGARLTEAKHINTSLTHLKSVLQALAAKNDQHVPFRNSALTALLQDSLGGNCKCLMFANVSVLEANVPESICTLKYATEARRVEIGKVTSRAKAM